MIKIKFSNAVAISLLAVAALLFSSCGDASQSEEGTSGHKLTSEDLDRIVVETIDDLNTVASVETDTSALSTAMTGDGLEQMKSGIEKDLAAGKIKKRDYRNITATFEEFNFPFAEVLAEFDDFSYYVDANTGANITQPTGQHMRFAMAVVEEEGRWKIQGVFAPSTPETPRELVPTTTTGISP